jgi:hypothetical protein
MDNLTLEIADVDDVEVDEAKCPDPGRREIEGRRRTKAARADAKHAGRLQPPLPFHSDFGEEQVAAVALTLLGREAAGVHLDWIISRGP